MILFHDFCFSAEISFVFIMSIYCFMSLNIVTMALKILVCLFQHFGHLRLRLSSYIFGFLPKPSNFGMYPRYYVICRDSGFCFRRVLTGILLYQAINMVEPVPLLHLAAEKICLFNFSWAAWFLPYPCVVRG